MKIKALVFAVALAIESESVFAQGRTPNASDVERLRVIFAGLGLAAGEGLSCGFDVSKTKDTVIGLGFRIDVNDEQIGILVGAYRTMFDSATSLSAEQRPDKALCDKAEKMYKDATKMIDDYK